MNFNIDGVADDIKALIKDTVAEITDEASQQIIVDLANDAALIATMKVTQGVDPVLIERADAALRARIESLAGLPAVIAANKQQKVRDILTNITNTLINFGFAVLRARLGIL